MYVWARFAPGPVDSIITKVSADSDLLGYLNRKENKGGMSPVQIYQTGLGSVAHNTKS